MSSHADQIALSLNADPLSNSFESLAKQLHASLYPAVDQAWRVVLRTSQGLFAASLLGAIVGIALASIHLRQQFWLIRLADSNVGRIAQVNTSLAFLVLAGLVSALCIVIEELAIHAYYDGGSTWVYEAVATPLWSLFLLVLGLQAYSAASSVFVRYSLRLGKSHFRAWHLHALFVFLLALDLVVFALYVVADVHLRRADTALQNLVDALLARAPSWSIGDRFVWQKDWLDWLDTYTLESARYYHVNHGAYIALAVTSLLNLAVFVPAASLTISLLRSHERLGEQATNAFTKLHAAEEDRGPATVVQERQTILHRTVKALIVELLLLLVVAGAFTAYALALATKMAYILGTARGVEVAFGIGFWLFNATTAPIVTLLLYRQYMAVRRLRAQRRPKGITVSQSTMAFVETATRLLELDVTDAFGIGKMALQREQRLGASSLRDLAFVDLQLIPIPVMADQKSDRPRFSSETQV